MFLYRWSSTFALNIFEAWDISQFPWSDAWKEEERVGCLHGVRFSPLYLRWNHQINICSLRLPTHPMRRKLDPKTLPKPSSLRRYLEDYVFILRVVRVPLGISFESDWGFRDTPKKLGCLRTWALFFLVPRNQNRSSPKNHFGKWKKLSFHHPKKGRWIEARPN